jgi:hypothetical protein
LRKVYSCTDIGADEGDGEDAAFMASFLSRHGAEPEARFVEKVRTGDRGPEVAAELAALYAPAHVPKRGKPVKHRR